MPNLQHAIITNLGKYQWYTHLSRTEGADLNVIKQALRDVRAAGSNTGVTAVINVGLLFGPSFLAALTDDVPEDFQDYPGYESPDGNVAPFTAWPDPTDGQRVRVYPLAEHPLESGKLGRIFRCSTVMVNVLPEDDQPRDPTQLSPHHHDDFEQLSLQLSGDYVHHMRTPWTTNMAEWRDDEHRACASPAVTVIPPPVIHTTQAMGHMRHQLIDIFSPPRLDFSQRPGWVLNADEYPMPA